MPNTVGPKINVVDSIPDGAYYGVDGRTFLRMWQTLIQPNVINMTTSTPPGSPSNGDTYVVDPTGAGAWVGKNNNIAYWSTDNPLVPSGEWEFYVPLAGWIVGNQADGFQYKYTGSAWVQIPIGVNSLNSGTSASSSTFWRGDGMWATPSGQASYTTGAAFIGPGLTNFYTLGLSSQAFPNGTVVGVYSFSLPYTITLGHATVNVTGGSNGNVFAFGIYNQAGTTLLVNSGVFTVSGTGVQTNSFGSVVLPGGYYNYAFIVGASAGATADGFGANAVNIGLYNAVLSRIGTAANAGTSGAAFPATLGTITGSTTLACPTCLWEP